MVSRFIILSAAVVLSACAKPELIVKTELIDVPVIIYKMPSVPLILSSPIVMSDIEFKGRDGLICLSSDDIRLLMNDVQRLRNKEKAFILFTSDDL